MSSLATKCCLPSCLTKTKPQQSSTSQDPKLSLSTTKTHGKTNYYHLVMTNIAMENPRNKCCFWWENHLFLWAIYTMAMLVITGSPGPLRPQDAWILASPASNASPKGRPEAAGNLRSALKMAGCFLGSVYGHGMATKWPVNIGKTLINHHLDPFSGG